MQGVSRTAGRDQPVGAGAAVGAQRLAAQGPGQLLLLVQAAGSLIDQLRGVGTKVIDFLNSQLATPHPTPEIIHIGFLNLIEEKKKTDWQ